ncbi:ABC transporter substrate-binding protein [Candidatus Paracaedibacter symbiosus]|uniref:ABC transporter substrate-binding protein n=1 Tax=Candidatus Paracaedibacter symbiosus TaxID=244582 RepID=UPI0005097C45|nr:ABC transporter substrate-binding protein [Candidatus Paracaedibacter symbiosus]
MNKIFKCLLSLVIAAGSVSHAEVPKEPAGAVAKPYVIYLDWFLNPHHAPLVIGLKKGFFKEHGLDVELVSAGGSEEGSKQVSAGKGNLAVSKQSAHVVRIVNQQLSIVRVATIIDRPLECLITSEDCPDIKSLKGKRIGFTSSSIEFSTLAIATILEHNGLKLDDVTLVPIITGMPAALLSGQVDAIFSAYRTYELEDIHLHKFKTNVFYYENNGIPPFEQVILVAHKDKLDQPELKQFLVALKQSTEFIKQNPEEAWKIYAAHAPEQDTDLNHKVFLKVSELLQAAPEKLDRARYEKFAAFLEKSAILKEKVPAVDTYAKEISLNNG